MSTTHHQPRLTRSDLADTPDDGRRYELLDGELVVSAAPSIPHQFVVGNLHVLLRASCPSHLRVMLAPTAVGLAEDTELQPDLLVAPRAQFTDRDLPGPPMLAIEVLSPSTRRIDLGRKRSRLERAGCHAYWVVDPLEPRLIAWQLADGAYREVADVSSDETWAAVWPFPVAVVPAELLD